MSNEIRFVGGSEFEAIKNAYHKGWDSLDEYVESATMTTAPDANFESQGQMYSLLIDGTSMVSRFDEPSAEDRYRLSSCAVVIYRGTKEKPMYFINYDDGLDAWDKLCADKGHLEAKFKDAPPATGNKFLN